VVSFVVLWCPLCSMLFLCLFCLLVGQYFISNRCMWCLLGKMFYGLIESSVCLKVTFFALVADIV